MNPGDFIGTVVMVGSVALVLVAIVWLPILRRRELAQITEEKRKPIFVELLGSIKNNAEGIERTEMIEDLSAETELVLKRTKNSNSEEAGVGVFTAQGHSLGLLPTAIGRDLAKELAAGRKIDVKVDLLTGGTERNPDYYIKLVLKRQPQGKRKRG